MGYERGAVELRVRSCDEGSYCVVVAVAVMVVVGHHVHDVLHSHLGSVNGCLRGDLHHLVQQRW